MTQILKYKIDGLTKKTQSPDESIRSDESVEIASNDKYQKLAPKFDALCEQSYLMCISDDTGELM